MFFRTDLAVEGEEASRTAPPEEKRNGCRITRMELRGEQAPPVPQAGGPVHYGGTAAVQRSYRRGQPVFGRSSRGAAGPAAGGKGWFWPQGLATAPSRRTHWGPRRWNRCWRPATSSGELSRITGEGSLRAVAAVSPNVLGNTGMETLEILQGLCGKLRPSAVVAVDALAARSVRRLGRTVQLSDAGIAPRGWDWQYPAAAERKNAGDPGHWAGRPHSGGRIHPAV